MQPQPQLPPSAPAPPPPKPAAPLTVEQVEIVHYKKKLVKLERKRRQWGQAFDQKLAAYKWAFTLTKELEAGIRS